ncbi:MAG: hypothetical protein K0S33_1322 [Bacteroidetes bacterium]|jgi:hypothetical protein|nr:hypothetical protein [Bacteroidota bacterium]
MKLFRGTTPSPIARKIALTLVVLILSEIIFPTATFALTSGPSAPEFSSFEPVSTTSMVNEFSGDFTYNIPVINIPGAAGGGYAMSLSYHSGESVESEASWVGYGWTLNPGAINRGKRGFADDTKNSHTYYNDVPANWTVSAGASVGNIEALSSNIPISANASIRYNNYKGFGYTAGAGLAFRQGLVTLGYSVSDGNGSFSAQVNPGALLKSQKEAKAKREAINKYRKAKEEDKPALKTKALADAAAAKKTTDEKSTKGKQIGNKAKSSFLNGLSGTFGTYTMGEQQHPTTVTPYDGFSFNASMNLQNNPSPLEIGPQFGFFGNYNSQKNLASVNRAGYGYMYSEQAYSNDQGVMDYYLEKESTYNKRDRYLSIPFSNADMFSVTGEGIGGNFKLYNRYSGHFRPNSATSSVDILQVSGDASLGFETGGGVTIGLGSQELKVNGDGWGSGGSGNTEDYRFHAGADATEPYFFRFDQDLGGNVDFDPNNKLVSASLAVDFGFPGLKFCHPSINTSDVNTTMQSTIGIDGGTVDRSGRSSYIGYHLNSEITGTEGANSKKRIYAYEKSADSDILVSGTIDRTKTEQVGEIATINEEGNQYVYGLPVNVSKETSLQYDLAGVGPGSIQNNFVAYKDISSHKVKVGEVDNGTYANAYLLTHITTPDYVDRTMNGPTPDDFGGYTKFQYTQLYKTGTNPYHFRAPYTGLSYGNGDMTDPTDDVGSYSSGDKDVCYLNQIVTKTHIAKFITTDREDGIEADNDATAANNGAAKGIKKLKKLSSIELWTCNDDGSPGKLVKKVLFKYDYSLCQNVPNQTGALGTGKKGKLTLKELWFEYDGIISAKISPYKFNYEYPNTATTYPAPYNFWGYSGLTENPDYSPFAVDAWGNYQDAGTAAARFADMKTGVNQTPPTTFDPAAWQLKRITLPSGGEIHVEYEQDDYLYVQDRRAASLVSIQIPSTTDPADLLPLSDPSVVVDMPDLFSPRSYILKVDEINVMSLPEKQALVELINQNLQDDKIYFKFLYALIGTAPDIGKCNSDYITGYTNFRKAYVSMNGKVIVQIGDPSSSDYVFPRQVCLDKVKKEKGGKLNAFGNCDASVAGVQQEATVGETLLNLLTMFATLPGFAELSSCLEINDQGLSYFKIPVLKPKKGGGLRVKRILMYDENGIDTGVKSLYGTEYIYQTENGQSSGVSTNEPASLRDENPLVTFLPKRMEQDFLNKIVSGEDKTQFEGPIGESLLPAASVGYSRVVSKNIHSGKTNTGFTVSEFFTAYDYPFDMTYNNGTLSGVSNTAVQTEDDWMNLPAVIVNFNISNMWATQGYRFVLNSMHGQPKAVSSYAGDYVSGTLTAFAKSSSTEYEYFQPGEAVNVQRPDGTVVPSWPGKDMDVTFEMKQVEDVTVDASIEVDFGVGIAGIIPLPEASLSPSVNYTESKMRSHVTSKVIRFPVIQKAVTSTQDGIRHRTENLVFSEYSGKPLITRTTDGYNELDLPSDPLHNGTYTSYGIPAYSQYADMGQKAINERAMLTTVAGTIPSGTTFQSSPNYAIVFPSSSDPAICNALKIFSRGDLIKVNTNYFNVDNVTGTSVNLLRNNNLTPAVSIGTITSIEVIRSGRTNQLMDMAGSYVTYGNSSFTPSGIADLSLKIAFINALNGGLSGVASTHSPYSQSLAGELCFTDTKATSVRLSYVAGPPEVFRLETFNGDAVRCTTQVPYSATGQFFLDNSTGQMKYRTYPGACFSYDVACMAFCNGATPASVSKVIASSATIYDYLWTYDPNKYASIPGTGYNAYETGEKGKWRPKENYVFKTSVVGGAAYPELNHKDAGTYLLTMFNWKNPALNANTPWIRTSTVTMYSPNGEALEEMDALGIYSTAKFGYNNMLPYLVSDNARNTQVLFESFEKVYGTKLEDGVNVGTGTVDDDAAHSGKYSYILSGSAALNLNPITITGALQNGLSLKVWVKDPAHTSAPLKGQLTGSPSVPLSFKKIAQTGEWTLYEAVAKNLMSVTYTPQVQSNLASGSIRIDDVRLQPLEATMTAYVYDIRTLRLITSFDDQHFGLYYQYNQEGKLVRKMIETEKGMKTVTETQYHTPTVVPTSGLY